MFRQYYGVPNNAKYGEGFMARFPILFQNRAKSMKETCMCWGIDCPLGWYHIIDQLCTVLEFYNLDIGRKYHLAIVADQVKEKFGTLRFYFNIRNVNDDGMIDYETDYPDARIQADFLEILADNAISKAEDLTERTCATCGIPLDVTNRVQTKGWITYICKRCDEKRNAKAKEDEMMDGEEEEGSNDACSSNYEPKGT